MEDPSFKLKGINIISNILSYFYLGLLIMCFILSLGNRPQGSKWGYTTAFIGFAVIMAPAVVPTQAGTTTFVGLIIGLSVGLRTVAALLRPSRQG